MWEGGGCVGLEPKIWSLYRLLIAFKPIPKEFLENLLILSKIVFFWKNRQEFTKTDLSSTGCSVMEKSQFPNNGWLFGNYASSNFVGLPWLNGDSKSPLFLGGHHLYMNLCLPVSLFVCPCFLWAFYASDFCQIQLRLQLQLQLKTDFALFSFYPPTHPVK